MNQTIQKTKNRGWMLLNYLSLIAIVVLFNLGKYHQWSTGISIAGIASVVIFIGTFWRAFLRTRFWKMVHMSSQKLDEREISLVLNALKYSYSIFTILCIVIIYAFAITGIQLVDVVLAGGLLYLAHTLPAVVVGWNEKSVIDFDQ